MKGNDISDGCGNSWSRCKLGADCGLHVVRPGKAQCWCQDEGESRERVAELIGHLVRFENYVAALEDECTPEQLRAARKSVETSRSDHIGDINEMIQLEKKAQQ